MSRNESYQLLDVSSIQVKLAWANLQVITDHVPDIQLLISGDESDVTALKTVCQDGKLLVDQSMVGIPSSLTFGRWMDVILRIPYAWKGAVSLSTLSGRITAKMLTGSDLSMDTVSGDLHANALHGITVSLANVSGAILADDIVCDKLELRSVTGKANLINCSLQKCSAHSVSSDWHISMNQPFDSIDAVTVSGNLLLQAPVTSVLARYKSVSGRLRTWGVSLQDAGLPVTLNTVSGNLEITAVPAQAAGEE